MSATKALTVTIKLTVPEKRRVHESTLQARLQEALPFFVEALQEAGLPVENNPTTSFTYCREQAKGTFNIKRPRRTTRQPS